MLCFIDSWTRVVVSDVISVYVLCFSVNVSVCFVWWLFVAECYGVV